MALDRNSLLNKMRLKTELVELDGETVIMSELSGPDYMKLYTDPLNRTMKDGVEVMEMGRFQAALIVYGAVDEKNKRIFKDEDIDEVARGCQDVFFKLAEAARKLNGMSGEEAKNSKAIQEGSQSGELQSDLDTVIPAS